MYIYMCVCVCVCVCCLVGFRVCQTFGFFFFAESRAFTQTFYIVVTRKELNTRISF